MFDAQAVAVHLRTDRFPEVANCAADLETSTAKAACKARRRFFQCVVDRLLEPMMNDLWVIAHLDDQIEISLDRAAIVVRIVARAVRLREKIYSKLLRLGPGYSQVVSTSQLVQNATEGVEQLDIYFGGYLPQFFYSMIAPLTLFAIFVTIEWKVAAALILCVPLIPASIAAVQRYAKKRLSQYWTQYTTLGSSFLENLQGLTTLKIYQADERKQKEMDVEAEHFRKITMKVLSMQLNSIIIMDMVAFGGAALGMVLAVMSLNAGTISFAQGMVILLLSAEFFLPLRALGSFFHVAMNGMAASDRIFELLDLPEDAPRTAAMPSEFSVVGSGVDFAYEADRPILKDFSFHLPEKSFTAIVGESGSGKSTLAGILTGRCRGYAGSIRVGGTELEQLSGEHLARMITYVGFQNYLFRGTVEENLRMAKPDATETELWNALERVKIADFLRSEQGLATPVEAQGTNFSGGQRQRLALARALLHDTPIYIFDEASSNIDMESEHDIMAQIHELARTRTVLLISHRLANVAQADRIYVIESGVLAESGPHDELLAKNGVYANLWNHQHQMEQYGQKGEVA